MAQRGDTVNIKISEEMLEQVGARVMLRKELCPNARLSNWEQSNLFQVGIICSIRHNGKIAVTFDNGTAGDYDPEDIVIVDNSPAGIVHKNSECIGCQKIIYGILWQCMECMVTLCSSCYHNDRHSLNHRFIRYPTPNSIGHVVEARLHSSKVISRGIFPGTRVVKGQDWAWGRQDSGVGTVISLVDFGNTPNSGVKVLWQNNTTNNYRIGIKGKIDLKGLTFATFSLYHNHLPICLKSNEEQFRNGRIHRQDVFEVHCHIAASTDNHKVLAAVIKAGADVNTMNVDSLDTPLHIASMFGHVNAVKILLQLGADQDLENIFAQTPLLCAIKHEKNNVISLLLEQNLKNFAWTQALEYAALRGNSSAMKILLEKLPHQWMIEDKTRGGNTILHIAVNQGDFELTKLLIQTGKANIDAQNEKLETPLHLSVRTMKFEMVQLLIDEGCRINIMDNNQESALHYAMFSYFDCKEKLSQACGNMNDSHTQMEKLEADHKACEKIALYLASNGANIDLKNGSGETPLDLGNEDDDSLNFALKYASKRLSKLVSIPAKPVLGDSSIPSNGKAKEELEMLKERITCAICLSQPKGFVFECGHSVCSSCVDSLVDCPFCRIRIRKKIRLY